jgi:outer membrane protein assembly factor BamB
MLGQSCKATVCVIALICVSFLFSSCTGNDAVSPDNAGVQGGLVVHVGSGNGQYTASMYTSDSYRIHGLDTSADNLALARQHAASLGLQGKVTFAEWSGNTLPYIDNLVNLILVEESADISTDELLRVLAPQGKALVKKNGVWTQTVKPLPTDTDEWTHYLHNASNNPVAQDTRVGPPRHLQWIGGPKWSRHHDHMSSLTAMVSANGRVFYVMDEGSKDSIQLPPKWFLVARDAYNGVVLWKKPIAQWYNHLWPLKSGHSQLPRRLVAIGDRVYVTLGINEPLSAIDAATGDVVHTYDGTKTAEEILFSNDALLLAVNPNRQDVPYAQEDANCWTERDRASYAWGWDETPRAIMSIDPVSGKVNWQSDSPVVPLSLASDGKHVVFHDGESIVSLDQTTGAQQWRSEPIERVQQVPTGYMPSLRMQDDVVLFSGKRTALTAVSAIDGAVLWTTETHRSGHFTPEDFFVIDGLVWSGDIASGNDPSKRSHSTGLFTGYDLHTGEVKREFPYNADESFFMHQRCYPSKATSKYILAAWTGTEFVDLENEDWDIHHWVRGSCVYGIMPGNGLLYSPPHSCACYYQSKLNGLNALSSTQSFGSAPLVPDETNRLVKGPAYNAITASGTESAQEWPTYRRNAARSGATDDIVSATLNQTWRSTLSGNVSAPVAAEGKLFVASIDHHTLHALDAKSGQEIWQFAAGGRVDSPPTIHKGRVLFGSADGYVYCLRASDGALAWRFRAAPRDLRHVAFGQVESVWPVSGSVLVQNDEVYCIAGRLMFVDGGMRMLRINPETGEKISETVLDDQLPESDKNMQTLIDSKKLPVALPDILSSDGEYVYMRSQRFDLKGKRTKIAPEVETDQEGDGIHLFSPIGFLDDSWFHRGYWIYGKNAGEGWGEWFIPGRLVPSGRILVYNDQHVFGYARDPEYLSNSSILEYRLFAASKRTDPARVKKLKNAKEDTVNWLTRSQLLRNEQTAVDYQWLREHPPLFAKAMTLAGKTLFVAGPPDVMDEKEARGRFLYPETRAKLDRQQAALNGSEGAVLWALSTEDGATLSEMTLNSPPRFDGMIAAYGNLYVTLQDGSVICLKGSKSAD